MGVLDMAAGKNRTWKAHHKAQYLVFPKG